MRALRRRGAPAVDFRDTLVIRSAPALDFRGQSLNSDAPAKNFLDALVKRAAQSRDFIAPGCELCVPVPELLGPCAEAGESGMKLGGRGDEFRIQRVERFASRVELAEPNRQVRAQARRLGAA